MKLVKVFNSSSIKFLPIKKVQMLSEIVFADYKVNSYILNVIYMNNTEIQNVNKEFLNHDYPTDVISFEIDSDSDLYEVYIGAEIAKEQSKEYGVSLTNEILRLVVHGILHLCGFSDKDSKSKDVMTSLENKYLGYAGKNC